MMKLQRDKALHFAACATVSFVMAIGMALLSGDFLCATVSGFCSGVAIGVGKEYGDSKAAGNKWDWYDLLADVIGSIIGAILGSLFTLTIY